MVKSPAPDGTSTLGGSAPGMICTCRIGPEGELAIPFASPGIEEIFGVKAGEVSSRAMALARVHPDDLERARASLRDAARTSSPWRGEFRVLHPERGELLFEAHGFPGAPAPGETTWHVYLADVTEARREEGNLRIKAAGQERLARMIEAAPGMVYTFRLRPDGRTSIPFATSRAEKVAGLRPEELAEDASPFFARVHAEDLGRLRESIAESARTMTVWHSIFRLRHPEKGDRWVEGRSIPEREGDGGILWYGFIDDVTDVVRAEAASRESEERLRIALDAAALGTWEHDFGAGTVRLDEAARRHFGIARDVTTFEEHVLTTHPDDIERVRQAVAVAHDPARSTGRIAQEHRVILPTGEVRWLSVRAHVRFEGEGAERHPGRTIGTSQDITDRKEADHLVQASGERFSRLFHLNPTPTSLTRMSDHLFLDVNEAYCALTGYGREELVGQTPEGLGMVLPEREWKDVASQFREIGRARSGEAPIRTKGGEERIVVVSLASIEILGQHCALSTTVDVTDRARAHEALARSQKLEALGTLAGGIAHDFNNILLAIGGNASLAMADLGPDHAVQESLKEIGKAAARATTLVKQILNFSRPGDQKRTQVHLGPVVKEALSLVRATTPALVEIRASLDAPLRPVLADPTQVHQVVVNLATNAVYAIGPGTGVIDIRLDEVVFSPGSPPAPPGLGRGRYARLVMTDDGCGMDAATLARIFDPFFTTKPLGKGTGLGLSVAHGIMRALGGAITVESAPGKGSSFAVYFPEAKRLSSTELTPLLGASGRREARLLYVDDEEALAILMPRLLERLGYKVTGETDPLAALRRFREEPGSFDAVITDVAMPGMSGFDLARELLTLRPELPVIVTSGYIRPEDEEAAKEIGVRAVVLKPDTVDEMAAALDRIFQGETAPRA